MDQPAFARNGDCFGTANRFQLGQNGSDVTLDGRLADVKRCPYLLIALAIGDIFQDLKIPLREFGTGCPSNNFSDQIQRCLSREGLLALPVRGGIGEFLNLLEQFPVFRGFLLRIIQVFEQAGEAYEIISNR